MRYFWAGILKSYCHIWNQRPQVFISAKFCKKRKIRKCRSKNDFLKIFAQKLFIWLFQGNNLEKPIVVFEIRTLKFVQLEKCSKKTKTLKIGNKNTLLVYFRPRTLKKLFSYLKSAPSKLSNLKIVWKKRKFPMLDQKYLIGVFLTKNALFAFFRTRILKETIFIL